MIQRVGMGLGLFFGSLLLGWFLHRRHVLSDARATRLMRFVVRRLTPVVLALSFWRLQIRQPVPWLLPVIGALISLSTLLPARAAARLAGLTRPQTGSLLICSLYSNLGFFGAFVAFAMFGEQAYGLAVLYVLFFSPSFYSLGFGLARRFGVPPVAGSATGGPSGAGEFYRPDELRWYPLAGIGIGVALNLAGFPRPALGEWINYRLIPVDTALYMIAIGSQLSLRLPRRWVRISLAASAIKFWWSPLVGWGLVSLFGVEGLPRFIVLLQSSMPVGVSPLMLSMLFGLDRRLTTSLFVVTTLLAIPWLLLYLPLIR